MESHVSKEDCHVPDQVAGQGGKGGFEDEGSRVGQGREKGSARTGGRTLDISLYPSVGSERSIH
jgi:hypothetical protein